MTFAPSDLFVLRTLAQTLDDLEVMRIETSNRIGAAEREIGDALPHLHYALEPLREAEHRAELALKRSWRKHPLAPWAKQIPGCGEKLIARLVAETGDPGERPNVAKLWAYCGHGDPARSGQIPKGATQAELFARGNPAAKKATWKLAKQFTFQDGKPDKLGRSRGDRSPYRDLYEQRKSQTEGRVHAKACVRCGPSGKPAQPGSEWSDAHRHADALRIVGKEFLKDLWLAARATPET